MYNPSVYSLEFIAKAFCPELRHLSNDEIQVIELGQLTQEGNNMNEIMEPTVDTPFVDLVEILDINGNPTGEYRLGETPQEGATVYTTAEDGDHKVVLN